MEGFTEAEVRTMLATRDHIDNVRSMVNAVVKLLLDRGMEHDASKLSYPELQCFTEYTGRLRDTTYMSEEYKQCLAEMKPALDHHYANNRHHPEFHEDGIAGMTLLDLVELICDWRAASMRHADGDVYESIVKNAARFGIDEQLVQILQNTAQLLERVMCKE